MNTPTEVPPADQPLSLSALLERPGPPADDTRADEERQERLSYAHALQPGTCNPADARRRLMQDLQRIQREENSHFTAGPVDGDLFHWRAVVLGPDNTAWEGGVFKLRLDFTDAYPSAPPVVRFMTKNMFHPNVYLDGNICLDTLKSEWKPVLDVESLLMMIISLLSDPNPRSAANAEAASLYTSARDKYDERVRRLVEESLEQAFSDDDNDDDEVK